MQYKVIFILLVLLVGCQNSSSGEKDKPQKQALQFKSEGINSIALVTATRKVSSKIASSEKPSFKSVVSEVENNDSCIGLNKYKASCTS